MKALIILIICLFYSTVSISQNFTFEKRVPSGYFQLKLFKNPVDNHLYLYKSSLYGITQNNIDLVKVDFMGNILQNIAIEHPSFSVVNSILPVTDGFVVGSSAISLSATSKSRMIKINNAGIVQWSKDYNISFSYYFTPVLYDQSKNEIISIANINSNSTTGGSFVIHKTDTNGIVLDAYKYDAGNLGVSIKNIVKLNNGNYVSFVGIHAGCCQEPVFLFMDSLFNVISGHKLQTSIGAIPEKFSIIKKDDDGFLIIGGFYNSNGLPFGFLVNVDENLNPVWSKYTDNNVAASGINFIDLIADANNNYYYILGNYYNSHWERDILVTHFTSNGDFNWGRIVGTNGDEIMNSFVYEENVGIFIAGMADSTQVGFGSDGLFIKTDFLGNTVCPGGIMPVTTNNFNVNFAPLTINKSSISVADSNVATSPLPGMTFIDACSGNVSVNETTNNSIKIFPNPAKDQLTITNLNFNNKILLKITDVTGRTHFFRIIDKNHSDVTIDISGFKNGIYFLQLMNQTDTIHQKFIINK